jgi:hypothetical protein
MSFGGPGGLPRQRNDVVEAVDIGLEAARGKDLEIHDGHPGQVVDLRYRPVPVYSSD